MGTLFFGVLVSAFVLILLWRLWYGRRRPGYLAIIEYWIYSDVQRLPPTAALMDAVVSKNPHNRPGKPSITGREGILFSDLRLHLGVARREKNPHAFRPDLFDEHAVPNAEALQRLSESRTLTKIQYASDVPLKDGRHLQFVTHLTDTMVRLTRGRLVFDTVTETFWLPDELYSVLQHNNDAEHPDLHVRIVWTKTIEGCRAVTLGLRKVGRPELQTALQESDEEVIVSTIVEKVARRLFTDPELQLPLEVRQHGGTFVVSDAGLQDGRTELKIVRKTPV